MTVVLLAMAAIALLTASAWRWADHRADAAVWAKLASHQPGAPEVFDPSMVSTLPEPAQRFFRFAIRPGTPLYTVAEVSMQGELGRGDRARPAYLPARAEQLLAAPHGFVWKLNAGNGLMGLSGSDAAAGLTSWTRFWLLNIVPVARAGGNTDHARSAFGRYVAEAVFWTPAALLPGNDVCWEAIDESTVRLTLRHMTMEQSVDLSIDADGKLTEMVFERWSDANALQAFQLQPFGGYLSEYRDFNGYRLPTKIEAGNFFGTPEYFPFFRMTVSDVRFPLPDGD